MAEETPSCEVGGSGLVLPLGGDAEQLWPPGLRAFLYLSGLLWFFMGVALAADIFMSSIESITSQEKKIYVKDENSGREKKWHVKVWNDTVANLTLMALGSSAPEIMLSVIELLGNNLYTGALGPGTIVGSAAFNLQVIVGICMMALPDGEYKKINDLGTYIVTATASMWAYLWLVIILLVSTPNLVEIWEGVLTFLFFPALVFLAYLSDRGVFRRKKDEEAHHEKVLIMRFDSDVGLNPNDVARLRHQVVAEMGELSDEQLLEEIEGRQMQESLQALREEELNESRKQAWGGGSQTAQQPEEDPNRNANTLNRRSSFGVGDYREGFRKALGAGNRRRSVLMSQASQLDLDKAEGFKGVESSRSPSPDEGLLYATLRPSLPQNGPANTPSAEGPSKSTSKFPPQPDPLLTKQEKQGASPRRSSMPAHVSMRKAADDKDKPNEPTTSPSGPLEDRRSRTGLLRGTTSVRSLRVTPGVAIDTAVSQVATDRDVVIEMASKAVGVTEHSGALQVKIRKVGGRNCAVRVFFQTEDGTAKGGIDFVPLAGELIFGPDTDCQEVAVEILSDRKKKRLQSQSYINSPGSESDGEARDDSFYVALRSVEVISPEDYNQRVEDHQASTLSWDPELFACKLGAQAKTAVLIVDHGTLGIIEFEEEEIEVEESSKVAVLTVVRQGGLKHESTVEYRTKEQTAVEGRDFVHVEGTLTFKPGETEAQIRIEIIDDEQYEKKETFQVILDTPVNCEFSEDTDGGSERAVAVVKIKPDEKVRKKIEVLASLINLHQTQKGFDLWREQIVNAIYVNGSLEEQAEANWFQWVMHVITFLWKLVLAIFVPPAELWGGWPCFILSLIMIGIQTAIIGDLAELFGCVVGIPDELTAITLVALGTSLPDTFASRTAILQDEYADAAVANVTGSNAVNVFLGLGLPWFIASIYWHVTGPTDEWKERYDRFGIPDMYPNGGFAVPAGNLGFSVIVFSSVACTTLAILAFRRWHRGAELGGPRSEALLYGSALVMLWVIYILMSALQLFGLINSV